jgi:dsDNA-specific endonuclease/ATPase MutS2
MDEPIEIPIEDTIDLHTFQAAEIASVVGEYLDQALVRGYREVRIIHGRGRGVQRAIVHSLLRKHPRVVLFKDAADLGSTTATLQVLPLTTDH